jgi:hypothetical protein
MLLPAATLVLAAGCGGANAANHAVPAGFGSWSLSCLGYHDLVLREDERDARASLSITYRLPRAARQGHGSWWLIRLHYRVAVRAHAYAPAEFNVAGSVNDSFFASTIWNLTRRRDGTIVLRSDDLGLVNGHKVHASTKLVREVHFSNYVPYRGVRPGTNVLRFDLTSNAVPLVRWVRIFADTTLVHQRRGPPGYP